eukprot:TRINITY_DN1073_c0_g1_i22.p1 TRINITY_DN1073_c0_g1~~TRINITY_DN1073_c0_g1_i22.p1  ORF type:complete len:153 (+),score=34.91 TRINITY_DN1073_c0_g1_i22:87-545(+)
MVSSEGKFTIISTAFKEGEMIPEKYTDDGPDVNPPLEWKNPPAATKSFALICDDPDTKIGIVHHWLLKNIPASVTKIDENGTAGETLPNIKGERNYIGPKPPDGTHRYFFKLYAMNAESLKATNKDELYKEVEEKKIGEAVLMGRYTRENKK